MIVLDAQVNAFQPVMADVGEIALADAWEVARVVQDSKMVFR